MELVLEVAEHLLGGGVVDAVALPAHGLADVQSREPVAPPPVPVLPAHVGVRDRVGVFGQLLLEHGEQAPLLGHVGSKEKNRIRTLREHIHGGHYHVTFEPMFDEVGMVDLTGIEWIVIGTETGHRKGKAVSKPEWVWNLTHQAHALGIPVFMKEDLLPIMGEAQMVQEFPLAFYRVLEEQKT